MLYPVRFLFTFIALSWAIALYAQCPTPPIANAGPDGNLTCSTLSITLIGSSTTPGATFVWSGPAGFTSITATPTVVFAGVYTLTVTDPLNGCTATDQVTITPDRALPIITVTSGTLSCINLSIPLTVASTTLGVGWNWVGPNGFASTQPNPIVTQAGNYTVTATDLTNGCENSATVPVFQDILPPNAAIQYTTGAGGCGATLTGTSTTPGATYQWAGPGAFSSTLTSITPMVIGTYTLIVTGANGCTKSDSQTVTDLVPIVNVPPNISVCGGINYSINFSGTPGATYSWGGSLKIVGYNNTGTGNINRIAPTLIRNFVDTITVTPRIGNCVGTPKKFILYINKNPYATLTGGGAFCPGSTVTLTAGGGAAYNWSNGATTASISPIPTAQTTYTVTITSAEGCAQTLTRIVRPGLDVITNQGYLCSLNADNGTIDLTITNGTPPYLFNWSNGLKTEDIANLTVGIYRVTATDAAGCSALKTYNMVAIPDITVYPLAACTDQPVGSISIDTSGTGFPHSFDWSHLPGSNDPASVDKLAAGSYTVTATSVNGCTQVRTVSVGIQDLGTDIFATPAECPANSFGGWGRFGAIDLRVVGSRPFPTFNYQWSSSITAGSSGTNLYGEGIFNAVNVKAGTYTVTISEVDGCTTTAAVTVMEPPPLTPTLVATPATCFGGTGTMSVVIFGGTPGYNFTWSSPNTNGNNPVTLPAGTYTVNILDNNNCFISTIGQITQPDQITATATTVPASGFKIADGSIAITASGGTPPYTLLWNNGLTTASITTLTAGSYTVTIRDAANCTQTASFTLTHALQPVVTLTTNPALCNGRANGSIQATVTGGVPPYTYIWSNGSTTQNLSGFTAGTYTVTATDNNGEKATATAAITQPPPLVATIATIPIACNGGNNGSINLNVTGGTSGYNYNWNNGATTQLVTNLTASTYTVTVTDLNGCTATAFRTVTQPTQLRIVLTPTPTNCTGNTGRINLTVTGGTPAYSYLWSHGTTTQQVTNLTAGNYTVTVTDANGCTATASGVVQTVLTLSATVTPVSCNGAADGSIMVNIAGGIAPYSYSINGGTNQSPSNNPLIINNLPAGFYTITVADGSGCTGVTTIIIPQPAPLTITPVFCESLTNVNVSGGTPPYFYQWQGGVLGSSQTWPPGNYDLTVTDANGCFKVQNIWVSPDPIPCTTIAGVVRLDANTNCLPENNELGLGNWVIQATQSTGAIFYAITGADGRYILRVVPGSFTVSAIPPPANANNTIICTAAIPVSLPQNGSTATADFAIKKVPQCPQMTVDITALRLRRCFAGNYYSVRYCNNGPLATTNAHVDITLDGFLVFDNATLPATALGNNVYRFPLGTVQSFVCKTFYIYVTVSCDAAIGQSHCTEAHIYPDSSCTAPNPQWSGAQVVVGARCGLDSLRFILKNTGKSPMDQSLEYIVIEDGIMAKMGQSALPLPAGDSMIVSVPANGRTWRIQARQVPFAPISKYPALSVEGCTNKTSFSTGFVTQFPTAVNGPWQDIDCTVNTGAFDPNDKLGTPLGFGHRHYVLPGTDIDYRIRFQNTGTDTALNVVIRDTLSRWLHPITIRPGASSHPYEFEITGNGILVFKFPNIMLPDSHINVRLSNGFVSYRISQRDSVPLESDILNRAAIYFDFNDAVITNRTIHRVGEDFITVRLWEPLRPEYVVRVMPQPMTETARIVVEKVPPVGDYQLDIFDLNGILVRTVQNSAPQFEVLRNHLATGMYIFSVKNSGELVGSGRLLIRSSN